MRNPEIDGVARALAERGPQMALQTRGPSGAKGPTPEMKLYGLSPSRGQMIGPIDADRLQMLLRQLEMLRHGQGQLDWGLKGEMQ